MPAADRERGAGLVATIGAVAAFLAFLFLAVQLLFGLHAASVVTATGYDAARVVASGDVAHDDPAAVRRARAEAEAAARASLGRFGPHVERFDWSGSDPDTVRLRVRARNPRFAFGLDRAVGLDLIDRTIEVRVERFR